MVSKAHLEYQLADHQWSYSFVSDSLWSHGLLPTRLLHPWNFPGKSTGVDFHFLLQGIFWTHRLNPGLPHCRQSLYCLKVKVKMKSLCRVRLFATPWTIAHQAPPSMGFSRQECWSGLPFPSPGDLPHPGIEPRSPALQADALTSEPPGKPAWATTKSH